MKHYVKYNIADQEDQEILADLWIKIMFENDRSNYQLITELDEFEKLKSIKYHLKEFLDYIKSKNDLQFIGLMKFVRDTSLISSWKKEFADSVSDIIHFLNKIYYIFLCDLEDEGYLERDEFIDYLNYYIDIIDNILERS